MFHVGDVLMSVLWWVGYPFMIGLFGGFGLCLSKKICGFKCSSGSCKK